MSLFNLGCLHQYVLAKLYYNIAGKVVDSDTDATLSCVEVVFWDDGYNVVLGKSDHNGLFNLSLDYNYCLKAPIIDAFTQNARDRREEKFTIELRKEGYTSTIIPFSTVVVSKDADGEYFYDVSTVALDKSY